MIMNIKRKKKERENNIERENERERDTFGPLSAQTCYYFGMLLGIWRRNMQEDL